MDSQKPRPVTIEEARQRVREAAQRASPREWIRQNPLEALAVAFMAGLSAGTGEPPSSGKMRKALDLLLRFMPE